MIDSLRLYIRYIGISIRSQMQYRVSLMLQVLGHFLGTVIEFFGIWALFVKFGNLKEWRLEEVALLYGIVHIAFALAEAFARGFDVFDGMVKSGDFDRLLLRPRGTVFQIAAQNLQLMRLGGLLQGTAILLWAVAKLEIIWTPSRILLVIWSIFGGTCLFVGLFVLQATLAFWTINTLEIFNTVTYGGVETAQFPMSIYRPWFRRFFTFVVPLACINYLPSLAILTRPDPEQIHPFFYYAAPSVGVLFLFVALEVWKIGVRHYCSTGS